MRRVEKKPRAAAPAVAQAVDSTVRVGVEKLDALMNLVGELVIIGSGLAELEREEPSSERTRRSREALAGLARLTRGLHEGVLGMRSLPVAQVFNRFPRLVHDLAERLGKQVELVVEGEATELDKTVLEKLGDPLVHLVRNSLDHGLEAAADREAAGKSAVGTLTLSARQQGQDVVITVRDDGRGLDPEKIFAVAVRRGVVAADAKLTVPEIQRLILAPGFSTAESVSDISGRGVGMDVVAHSIRALGGDLELESTVGEGTAVVLRLPLTLAIIDGQLVRFGGRTWVLPLQAISECVQLDPRHLSPVLGRGLVYDLRDETLPVLDPCAGFGLPAPAGLAPLVMVLEGNGERVALLVEEVVSRQQVVVKSLEQHLKQVEGLSGATVLGDGSIAFIIDVSRLRHAFPVALPPRNSAPRLAPESRIPHA